MTNCRIVIWLILSEFRCTTCQIHRIYRFADRSRDLIVDENGPKLVPIAVFRFGTSTRQLEFLTWKVYGEIDSNDYPHFDMKEHIGQIAFSPSQNEIVFYLEVFNDKEPERNESFEILLYGGHPPSTAVLDKMTFTILANDDPYGVFRISPRRVYIDEGLRSTGKVTIDRGGGGRGAVNVSYKVFDQQGSTKSSVISQADGMNYWTNGGVVTFEPHEFTKIVRIRAKSDRLHENTEYVKVVLISCSLSYKDPRIGTRKEILPRLAREEDGEINSFIFILGNDHPAGSFALTTRNVEVTEDSGEASVNITREGGVLGVVTIYLRLLNGSATLNSDYKFNDTKVSFKEDERRKEITVKILTDALHEPREYFILKLDRAEVMFGDGILNKAYPPQIIQEKMISRIEIYDSTPTQTPISSRVTVKTTVHELLHVRNDTKTTVHELLRNDTLKNKTTQLMHIVGKETGYWGFLVGLVIGIAICLAAWYALRRPLKKRLKFLPDVPSTNRSKHDNLRNALSLIARANNEKALERFLSNYDIICSHDHALKADEQFRQLAKQTIMELSETEATNISRHSLFQQLTNAVHTKDEDAMKRVIRDYM